MDIDTVALSKYLGSTGLVDEHTLDVVRLQGGQSNPTYLLKDRRHHYVLRKKPSGELLPSAHAVDREFRVMRALQGKGIPVPTMHLYCDDETVIGTPFYVMEYVAGRVMEDQALPGLTRVERAHIYKEMNRVIAALHQIDYTALGLADFGKSGNYFARQIARWTRQYRESQTDNYAAMNRLIDWLPSHVPAGDETVIVHGDYRLDNLVFHPTQPKIIAVFDWELSTLGHPLADFSYHCMSWRIPASLWRGIGGLDLKDLGIPSELTYVQAYCDAMGRKSIEHWEFYLAYNLFRMAAILQGIRKRGINGTASAADADEFGRKAGPLAEIGWQCAQRYERLC